MIIFLLSLQLFFISSSGTSITFSSASTACLDDCSNRTLAFPLKRGEVSWEAPEYETCDWPCRVSSCNQGCQNLDDSDSKCSQRCSQETVNFDSCFQGCHNVANILLSVLQEILNEVTVTISVVDEGVRLVWQFVDASAMRIQEFAESNMICYTQIHEQKRRTGWKSYEMPLSVFKNGSHAEVIIDNYLTGTIEVRLAIGYRDRFIVSRPLSSQLPSQSANLQIISQTQIAKDKLAVCWTGGKTNKYKTTLAALDGNILQAEEVTLSNYRCFLFRNLQFENCCHINIYNLDDENNIISSASTTYQLVNDDVVLLESANTANLLISNSTHLIQIKNLNDFILSEETTAYATPVSSDDTISALCRISEAEVVVGSTKGGVWKLNLSPENSTEENEPFELRAISDEAVKDISYDATNRFIYVVLSEKGITRCNVSEKNSCTIYVHFDSLNPIRRLAVDYINGFLYFLCADEQIYRSYLLPYVTPEGYTLQNIKMLNDLPPATSIELSFDSYHLIASLKNGSITAIDLVSLSVSLLRNGDFTSVERIRMLNGRMFWTKLKCGDTSMDEFCFYSEDEKNASGDKENSQPSFSRYRLTDKAVDFIFMGLDMPTLFSVEPPMNVSLITTDNDGKVSWRTPAQLEFQATEWRKLVYKINVNDNQEPSSEYQTDKTELMIPVRSSTDYTVKVEACVEETCSSSCITSDTSFSSLSDNIPFILLKRSSESLEGYDILGRPLSVPLFAGVPINIDIRKPFVIDNTTLTIYYSHNDVRFTPREVHVNISFLHLTVSDAITLSRTAVTDVGNRLPFASFSSIRHLTVLPSFSTIIISSHFQIAAFRLTGTFEHLYYTCSSFNECGEVTGLTSDDATGDIFYTLLYPNGTVALFETDQDDRSSRLIASTTNMPDIRQLLIAKEKIVFLTTDGKVGYSDKRFKTINIDNSFPTIDVILPINREQSTNAATISDVKQYLDEQKYEISWNIEPRNLLGKSIFKITLYREKLGSDEREVHLTVDNKLALRDRLLEAWDSAQKFDVTVEAVTPWLIKSLNKTGLQTPVKPPTVPINVRLFATQQKTVDGARAIISLFWDPPNEWNGSPFQYVVNCTRIEDGTSQGGPVSNSVHHYSFSVKSGKVTCQVAASNEPKNVGEFSTPISIDSSELKPLVRLFAIDSTNALMAITNISDEDSIKREKRQISKMEYQAIAFIGNDLYAVRKEPDTLQPVLVQIDTNDISNVIHKATLSGDIPKVEAMTSDWVAHRLLFVAGSAIYQVALDPFASMNLLNPSKLLDLTTGATDAKQLTFDPFKNTAYLLTTNGSLFSLNLSAKTELNMALTVSCLYSQTVTWMMTEFTWNRASSPKIYALTWNGLIVVDLEENSKCNEVRIDWNKFGEKGLKAMSAFAIADKLFVFVTSSEMLIYGRDNVVPIPIINPPLRQILAVSQSSQPFPDRSCFALPPSTGIQFTIENEGKTGSHLSIQPPPSQNTCAGVSFPEINYEIFFTRKNSDKVKKIRSFSSIVHVENGILDKETDYEVAVSWSNRYIEMATTSEKKPFRTGFGYPSAPRELQVVAVSPDTVYLNWLLPEKLNSPINEIHYKISQHSPGISEPSSVAVQEFTDGGYTNTLSDSATCLTNPCRVKVSNLRPSTEYKFTATALHVNHFNVQFLEDTEAVSQEISCRTKDIPGTLRPDNVTGSSIILRWNSLDAERPPTSIYVQYKESGNGIEWKTPSNASFSPQVSSILVVITNLLSATSYDYRYAAAYSGNYRFFGKELTYREDYYQAVQQAKTKAGVPTSPLLVEAHKDEEGWIVSWQEPLSDGGSPITSYAVEMRHNNTAEWEIAERGLDGWKLSWRPPARTVNAEVKWEFRVRAANQEGFGLYATSTDHKALNVKDGGNWSWSYIIVAIVALICLCALIYFILKIRRKRNIAKQKQNENRNCITLEKMAGHHAPDQPLSPEMLNELKNLPHVNPDFVTLQRQIGRGSFGEVYEGTATNLPMCGEKNNRVAIKTMKQGYDEGDKIKFMKEAILMNNFDHPNIVKLLGVNVYRDPLYLILEYMEEGNLLNFLKRSAPTDSAHSSLSLRQLLSMMVDIGRGGSYLETNHHVLRDLSARNCLISSELAGVRITKIADFGLGRKLFRTDSCTSINDEQDAIRWLSPESLTDNEFSSKSDIWSFGILMYEILGLGKEPYEDIPDDDIIEHIQKGQTPTKPYFCPDYIYRLMKKCWSLNIEKRPTFSDLLAEFELLREMPEFQDSKPFPPSGVHYNEGFYLSQESIFNNKPESPIKNQDQVFFNRQFAHSLGYEKPHSDGNRFERYCSNNASARKPARPSAVRSLRREKTKSNPSSEEVDPRINHLLLKELLV